MDKVSGYFHTFYQIEDTHNPGMTLAKHLAPSKVNDATPSEAEMKEAVRLLRQHTMGRHTHFCA